MYRAPSRLDRLEISWAKIIEKRWVRTAGIATTTVLALVAGFFSVRLLLPSGSAADADPPPAGIAASPTDTGADAGVVTVAPPGPGAQLTGAPPLDVVHQDQGISLPLPDGRRLWIFADSFQKHTARLRAFFVSSAVAVADSNSLRMRYLTGPLGTPVEFLPRTPAEKQDQVAGVSYEAVWPTGATLVPGGRVIISYSKYHVTVSTKKFKLLGSGLYEYRYPGLARFRAAGPATRIANDIWKPDDGSVGTPVFAGDRVYFTQCDHANCYGLRVPLGALTQRSAYEWWTGSGWSAARADRAPMEFAGRLRPGTTPSVMYAFDQAAYVMTSTASGLVSHTGLMWAAPTPYGPWSRPIQFPLPRCPKYGCYGLNVHPVPGEHEKLRVTYATEGIGPWVRMVDVPVQISRMGTGIIAR